MSKTTRTAREEGVEPFVLTSDELKAMSLLVAMTKVRQITLGELATDVRKIRRLIMDVDGGDPILGKEIVAEMGVDELGVRARRTLQRLGVATFGELIEKSSCDVLAMKNSGQTSLREIKKMLAKRNLSLRECSDPSHRH